LYKDVSQLGLPIDRIP
jgi:ribosomal protein RSM22 (predicted rRNA methylase)